MIGHKQYIEFAVVKNMENVDQSPIFGDGKQNEVTTFTNPKRDDVINGIFCSGTLILCPRLKILMC
jgi:hypothetical protein